MDLRVVDLPYLFATDFVAPGARLTSRATVKGFAPFEIPWVTDAEAPVSTAWTHNDAYWRETEPERREKYYPKGPLRTVTRTFEGRCYLPLSQEGILVEDVLTDLGNDHRSRGGGLAWNEASLPILPIVPAHTYDRTPLSYATEAELFRAEVDGARRGSSVRKKSDDAPARRAEAARTWREGLLVVDGMAWASQPDREPHYFLRAFPSADKPISLDVSLGSSNHYWGIPFRADRRADAVAYGKVLAEESGREFVDSLDTIEIGDPAFLVRDQAVMLAQMIARNPGLTITNRAQFEEWPEALEAAEARLMRSLKGRGSDVDLTATAETLTAFGEFRRIAEETGLSGSLYVGYRLAQNLMPHDYWLRIEAPLRPEMTTFTEDGEEASLAMGF